MRTSEISITGHAERREYRPSALMSIDTESYVDCLDLWHKRMPGKVLSEYGVATCERFTCAHDFLAIWHNFTLLRLRGRYLHSDVFEQS